MLFIDEASQIVLMEKITKCLEHALESKLKPIKADLERIYDAVAAGSMSEEEPKTTYTPELLNMELWKVVDHINIVRDLAQAGFNYVRDVSSKSDAELRKEVYNLGPYRLGLLRKAIDKKAKQLTQDSEPEYENLSF